MERLLVRLLLALVTLATLLPLAAERADAQSTPSPTPTATPTRQAAGGSAAAASPSLPPAPAPGSTEARMLALLNEARTQAGVLPVAWSPELGASTRAHGQDMATNGFLDHDGSDGSGPATRAARHGYVVPAGSGWLVIEAISAMPSVESAMNWLLTDGLHRRVLLRSYFREVGIAHVVGGPYGNTWVLDFGCRPNVLPVHPAPGGAPGTVALTFSNEDCAPYGGGPERMGRATQVMLSQRADFRDAVWEPFAPVREVAAPRSGELLARHRDDQGRESVPYRALLGSQSAAPASSTPAATPTPTPRVR